MHLIKADCCSSWAPVQPERAGRLLEHRRFGAPLALAHRTPALDNQVIVFCPRFVWSVQLSAHVQPS